MRNSASGFGTNSLQASRGWQQRCRCWRSESNPSVLPPHRSSGAQLQGAGTGFFLFCFFKSADEWDFCLYVEVERAQCFPPKHWELKWRARSRDRAPAVRSARNKYTNYCWVQQRHDLTTDEEADVISKRMCCPFIFNCSVLLFFYFLSFFNRPLPTLQTTLRSRFEGVYCSRDWLCAVAPHRRSLWAALHREGQVVHVCMHMWMLKPMKEGTDTHQPLRQLSYGCREQFFLSFFFFFARDRCDRKGHFLKPNAGSDKALDRAWIFGTKWDRDNWVILLLPRRRFFSPGNQR